MSESFSMAVKASDNASSMAIDKLFRRSGSRNVTVAMPFSVRCCTRLPVACVMACSSVKRLQGSITKHGGAVEPTFGQWL
jgi:hypothetical protein